MSLADVQNEYPMVYMQFHESNILDGPVEMVGYVQPGMLNVGDAQSVLLEAGQSRLVHGLVENEPMLIKALAPLTGRNNLDACTCSAVVAATGVRVCANCLQSSPAPVGCLHGQCPNNLPVEEIIEMDQATYIQLYVSPRLFAPSTTCCALWSASLASLRALEAPVTLSVVSSHTHHTHSTKEASLVDALQWMTRGLDVVVDLLLAPLLGRRRAPLPKVGPAAVPPSLAAPWPAASGTLTEVQQHGMWVDDALCW